MAQRNSDRSRPRVEDRWHRPPRRGESVAHPSDLTGGACWCTDAKHGSPGTMVATVRHGKGKRWLARWVEPGGSETSQAYDRKGDAQTRIREVTADLAVGRYASRTSGAKTFQSVAEEWLAGHAPALGTRTLADYRNLFDVVVLPRWGATALANIDHGAVQQWVGWLSTSPDARARASRGDGGLSPARVIHAFQRLDAVLEYAVRARYLTSNPAHGVRLPRKTPRKDVALSHEQIRALVQARDDIAPMVLTMAYTALRYGELAALRVGDVDLDRRSLRVSRSVGKVSQMGFVEGPTKTHQVRTIPILTEELGRVLAALVKDRPGDEYLFRHHDGGPVPLDWFSWRFGLAARAAGMTGISSKTLRHSAGSIVMASGFSPSTASHLMGHRNTTVTTAVYAHMLPGEFDRLREVMDKGARSTVETP